MASASCLSLLLLAVLASSASAQLSSTFYDTSCPNALSTIKSVVNAAVAQEARMGASLLRLHFHDCFVQASHLAYQILQSSFMHAYIYICNIGICMHMQGLLLSSNINPLFQGCDASVLLADTATFTGEQGAGPNAGSLRGFSVIDNIKTQVEAVCPQTVSCADILAVAARDSVVALGGPSWTVLLGRRDSTTASLSQANTDLPAPTSSLSQLLTAFNNKNLNPTDMVALSGAHTIGQAQCQNFRDHITESNINPTFAASLRTNCPASGGDTNLAPLDTTTPNTFDNAYYNNLMSQKGLLHSDQELFNNGSADNTVMNFASNAAAFSSAFTTAMVKMGNISPLTGTQGQIRLSCSKVN
ncbi:unnamed protein product [Urochloa decumbens]|uniref:Peroxidase n=1 Tax=Urochloa decumbens TaxID=240449 RepID=A0ABC9FAG2_9POAL